MVFRLLLCVHDEPPHRGLDKLFQNFSDRVWLLGIDTSPMFIAEAELLDAVERVRSGLVWRSSAQS
jgi:hypothetical protein